MPRARRPWKVTRHDAIEKLDDNLWTVNGDLPGLPSARRRMFIVRRSTGDLLFAGAAIPLEESALAEVLAWGRPAVLVVPHHWHMIDADAFAKRLGLAVHGPEACATKTARRTTMAGSVETIARRSGGHHRDRRRGHNRRARLIVQRRRGAHQPARRGRHPEHAARYPQLVLSPVWSRRRPQGDHPLPPLLPPRPRRPPPATRTLVHPPQPLPPGPLPRPHSHGARARGPSIGSNHALTTRGPPAAQPAPLQVYRGGRGGAVEAAKGTPHLPPARAGMSEAGFRELRPLEQQYRRAESVGILPLMIDRSPVAPFRLKEFLSTGPAAKAKGSLSSSYAELTSLQGLAELDPTIMDRLGAWNGAYPLANGAPELREAIAGFLGLAAADVIVTNGADDAIDLVYRGLLGPGDVLSLVDPAYEPLRSLAQQRGARVIGVALDKSAGWKLGPAGWNQLLAERPGYVALNLPNNPTGWMPEPAELDDAVARARRADALVLFDEIYTSLDHHSPEPFRSMAARYPGTITVGSLSKAFGMPGLRIGWVASGSPGVIAASRPCACTATRSSPACRRRSPPWR